MPRCLACGLGSPVDVEVCPGCGAALADPLIGSVLGDRYRVIERIGAGGMGAVYRALHTTLKRNVAIKVLLPELGDQDEFVRRFEREAESASRLAHPNIVGVTDFGRAPDGFLFLVMEFLDGRSLTSLIREGPVALPLALSIIRQILNALDHAHTAGIVHRDLKPDNIMLVTRHGRSDVVKILDFGIAKITDGASASAAGRQALTQAGMIFGTPEYLSPEQALGDSVDARADLYAAGVILFELLTARRPFESEDKVRIISMHLSHPPPPMSHVNPLVAIPSGIEDVVMQALEKQRDCRFASAAAFLTALDEGQADPDRPARAAQPAVAAEDRLPDGPPTPGPRSTPAPAPAKASIPPPRAPNPRRALRDALLAGFALAGLLAAGWALSSRRPSGARALPSSRVTRPAPVAAPLAPRIRIVEDLLAAGEIVKTRAALEQLLAENPRDARVRYLLGRLAFVEARHAEALDDYREAVALDPGFRGDPVLLEHLGTALGESKTADAALDLAIERVGRPAIDLLEKVANGGGDLRRRQRAARALIDLGEEGRVDNVSLRCAELKKATTCEERRSLVVALGKTEDPRALPALRSQKSRGGIESLFGADTNNACLKTELAEAIARVEAKLPPDKRPAARAPSNRPAAAWRPSIFRGR